MSVGATAAQRKKWKAGSAIQVYVETDAEWHDGKIVRITGSGKYEKLHISYQGVHGKNKIKLPRNSKHLNVDIFNSDYQSDDGDITDNTDDESSSSSSSEDESSDSSLSSSSSSSATDSDSESEHNLKKKKKSKPTKATKKGNAKKCRKSNNKNGSKSKSKTTNGTQSKEESIAKPPPLNRPKSKRAVAAYMKEDEDVLN